MTPTCIARSIVTVLALLGALPAMAQRQPVACQTLAAAGLKWEGTLWQAKRFASDEKFVLVIEGNTLTSESAGQAVRSRSGAQCFDIGGGDISCMDRTGGFLIFNLRTMRGAVAQLLGSTEDDAIRDTLSVEPFTCSKF